MSNSASEIGIPKLVASPAATSLKSAALKHEEPRIASSQKPTALEPPAVMEGLSNWIRMR
eukprot:7751501-Pyramimonas_sp.AAC.1